MISRGDLRVESIVVHGATDPDVVPLASAWSVTVLLLRPRGGETTKWVRTVTRVRCGSPETVAVPQDLLDAQAAQKLVIFVGAGASVAPPSGLPLFDRLARDLAELARIRFRKDVALDFFLGSMPTDFAVHAHARDLIAKADPPKLHPPGDCSLGRRARACPDRHHKLRRSLDGGRPR